jgi:hypothetical protein
MRELSGVLILIGGLAASYALAAAFGCDMRAELQPGQIVAGLVGGFATFTCLRTVLDEFEQTIRDMLKPILTGEIERGRPGR